jgi:DNA invertase Pin-like site-specific DNA recombinase
MIGIYADEGKSATGARRRPEFMRMIKDATSGKIDIILTKSIRAP